MKRQYLFTLLVLIVLGIYAGWLALQIVAPACANGCADIYRGVITGTGLSPYRYRVLSFGLVDFLGGNPQSDGAILITFALAYFILFPLAFIAYYAMLRRWLQPLGALLGVALLVLYMPVFMRIWGTSLYLVIELLLFSIALRWMRSGWLYAVLVILATLNRETGILLVLAYSAVNLTRWRDRHVLGWGVVYGLLWAAIYVGLRLWRGAAPDEVSIAAAWIGNTQSWHGVDALTNHLFFVPLYASVFLAWRWLNKELRRLFIGVVLPYLALVLVFGFWNEVRLLIPIMPFLTVALVTMIERAYLSPRQSSSTISA